MKRITDVIKNMIFVADEGDIENDITTQLNLDLKRDVIKNKIYMNDDNTRKYELYISDNSSIGFMESGFIGDNNTVHDKIYIVKDKLPLTNNNDINGFGTFFETSERISIERTGEYYLTIFFVHFSKWFIMNKNRYRTILANKNEAIEIHSYKDADNKVVRNILINDEEYGFKNEYDFYKGNIYDLITFILTDYVLED